MLVFNTCFPLSSDHSINDLLELGWKWRHDSPHSTLSAELETDYSPGDDCYISNATESITIAQCKYNGLHLGGIRHVDNLNKAMSWATEVVGVSSENDFWVSIKQSCESETPLIDRPECKKPYIVKLIMQHLKAGNDGFLPVSDKPIYCDENDTSIATKVITGDLGLLMPIVYISITNNGKHNTDFVNIARQLSGMAHVVVEPSVDFSFRLKKASNGINAYNGAIGIYWPGEGNRIFLVQKGKYSDPKRLAAETCRVVNNSLLTHAGKAECSWSFLQEVKTRIKIDKLKKEGSREVEKYIHAFDEEIESKRRELSHANKEIARLRSKLYNNSMESSNPGEPLLVKGDEKEYYRDEVLDLILSILAQSADGADVGTRKRVLIEDILTSNSRCGERERLLEELKQIFSTAKRLDSKAFGQLKQLGFTIRQDGKHYKLLFADDDRFFVTVSKTGSDYRTGQNTLRDIKRLFF